MSNFLVPDQGKIDLWGAELKTHGGQSSEPKIVRLDGKHWYVKHSPDMGLIKRELLAYSLGKNLVNITEVKSLTEGEVAEMKKKEVSLNGDASSKNTVLVRLAQEYSRDELPLKDLDSAVAGELVFSVWTRRRDAHEYNRAYTEEGIPVFFDHHASLLFEPNLADINKFFAGVGAGHAGSWRVREIGSSPLDIVAMRSGQWGGTHFVHNADRFKDAVQKMVESIASTDMSLRVLAEKAGFEGETVDRLVKFLEKNRNALSGDVSKMNEVIWKD